MLVGHQPSIGAMAAHFLGLQSFPKQVNPGTVIGLEIVENLAKESAALSDTPATMAAQLIFYAAPGHPLLEDLN